VAPKTDFDACRTIALGLPGTEEGTSYGTPAFRVRGKLFARLHQDGDALVVRVSFDQREALMLAHPRSFFITDHYRNDPWVLARLGVVSRALLAEVLEEAWRQRAPKRLQQELDQSR
jgi:hypothetical protein